MSKVVRAVAVMVAGAVIAATAFVLLRVNYSSIQATSDAMNPTIRGDDSLVVRKIDGAKVRRGDVVLFVADGWGPYTRGMLVTNRVAGVAGDTVACCDSQKRLVVNGKGIDEDYRLKPDMHQDRANYVFRVPVPEGQVFVLGDWRGNSADSRFNGAALGKGGIPTSDIQGVVIRAGDKDLTPTKAFTNAGLPGAPYQDDGLATILDIVLIAGGVIFLGGVIWLIAILRKRAGQEV